MEHFSRVLGAFMSSGSMKCIFMNWGPHISSKNTKDHIMCVHESAKNILQNIGVPNYSKIHVSIALEREYKERIGNGGGWYY